MSYTSKKEAQENAAVNLEIDSAKYIRKIEAEISIWNGKVPITVIINEHDIAIGKALSEKYREAGWFVKYAKGRTNAKYWVLTIS